MCPLIYIFLILFFCFVFCTISEIWQYCADIKSDVVTMCIPHASFVFTWHPCNVKTFCVTKRCTLFGILHNYFCKQKQQKNKTKNHHVQQCLSDLVSCILCYMEKVIVNISWNFLLFQLLTSLHQQIQSKKMHKANFVQQTEDIHESEVS